MTRAFLSRLSPSILYSPDSLDGSRGWRPARVVVVASDVGDRDHTHSPSHQRLHCLLSLRSTVEPRRPRVGGQREREREREGEGDSRVKRRSALTILPGPSPLTQTRIDVMPALCKRLAIASPVACAATVVPLRQFLNPSVPCPRDPPLVSTCPAKRATHAGPAHQDLLACRVASDASDSRHQRQATHMLRQSGS